MQQGPDKQLPVVLSSFFPDTHNPHRPDKRSDIARTGVALSYAPGSILSQEGLDTFVVWLGRIDCIQDVPVAVGQSFAAHLGNDIG